MQTEIQKVIEITGATEDQIKLKTDGYWSRAYVVNGGEFVVKFPKFDSVDYVNEAKFLNFINAFNPPINMQKVKWIADDGRIVAFNGVKGTPLSELKNLSVAQKDNLTEQLGNFLKQLHSLKLDIIGFINTKIKDAKLIQLIWKFLKAGYMEGCNTIERIAALRKAALFRQF